MFAAKIKALLIHHYNGEEDEDPKFGNGAYYLRDMLSDILHFCKINDISFDWELESAIEQFTQDEASE